MLPYHINSDLNQVCHILWVVTMDMELKWPPHSVFRNPKSQPSDQIERFCFFLFLFLLSCIIVKKNAWWWGFEKFKIVFLSFFSERELKKCLKFWEIFTLSHPNIHIFQSKQKPHPNFKICILCIQMNSFKVTEPDDFF